ncbi:S1/P1 nuclease [Lobosporangium transversale]|uniref:S1/P1 nuclease n=1 Tax=Lobosporangium transversale TaxID=64571 RepID=A0A1Y2GNR4_9FUNG|nr:S1/P1 nuclease [Lobosporangium transversale]ORZ15494.1 S1/P1 nuclease [Lobosporangium transversale]|eukprot:XP_021881242.1 S1/P1 nuclease [Lobosporangium transversale]
MRFAASLVAATAVCLATINNAHAYGILGHTLTGQVAQRFLTKETERQVKEILSPYYDGLLSKAAPWPDTIKGQAKYRWASILHYVNTPGDDPPETCHMEYNFSGKDVINGLFNMTATLKHYKVTGPTTPEDKSIREDALRFFVHFMGDLHQPLHTSGKLRGGNDAPTKWRRAKSNLHRIWDSQMIMKDIQDRYDNNPKSYLDDMLEMTSNIWQPEASNWTFCDPAIFKVDNPWYDTTKDIKTLCPVEWATSMNALACSFAWKDYDPLKDYSADYFENATGQKNGYLVQKLITMSGIRMAAILNEIYDPPCPMQKRVQFVKQG